MRLNKKFEKYSNYVDELNKYVEVELNKIELFKFQIAFHKEIERLSKIIKYAPAIEHILQIDKTNVLYYLDHIESIEQKYLDSILLNRSNQVKRFFKKEEKIDSLSEETLELVRLFFDFSVFIHFEFAEKNIGINLKNHLA